MFFSLGDVTFLGAAAAVEGVSVEGVFWITGEEVGGFLFLENGEVVSLRTGVLGFAAAFGESSPFFLLLRVTCLHFLSVLVFSASGVALMVLSSASLGCCMVSAVF